MARDDRLRKAQAAGVDFIETARLKAEEFLKELARAGGETQGALDDLVAGGRKTTEQAMAAVSKEIRNQIESLGLVTRLDLKALEARLTRRPSSPSRAKAPAASASGTATKSATAATGAKKAAPKKTAAKKTAAKSAAVKKVAGATGTAGTAGTAGAAAKAPAKKAPAKKASAKKTAKKTAG